MITAFASMGRILNLVVIAVVGIFLAMPGNKENLPM
jgi:hypothetical protein